MVTKNAFLYNDYWYAILNLLITLLQFSRLFKFTLFSVQMQQSNGFIGTGQSCGKKKNAMLKIKKCTWTRQTAWENGGHLATLPLVSRRNDVWENLDSALDWSRRVRNLPQPIRNTTQIWVVTSHQYGISELVSQTSFRRETTRWRRKMLAVFLR